MLHLAPTAGFANASQLYDTHLDYDVSHAASSTTTCASLVNAPHCEPGCLLHHGRVAARVRLLLAGNSTTVAFVMQGSGGQNTFWHDDRFAEVIRHIERLGHSTIFLGTAQDAANIDRIRALASSQGHTLAGQTTISRTRRRSLSLRSAHHARHRNTCTSAARPTCPWSSSAHRGRSRSSGSRSANQTPSHSARRRPHRCSALQLSPRRNLRCFRHRRLDDLLAQYPPSPRAREARSARLLSTRI